MENTLREALKATGIAEAYGANFVASVRDEEGQSGEKFLLSLSIGAMPPYFSKEYDSPEAIEAELNKQEETPLIWSSVEPE